jgi:hypothetical protein
MYQVKKVAESFVKNILCQCGKEFNREFSAKTKIIHILKLLFFLGDARFAVSSKINSQNNRRCYKNPHAVHEDSLHQLQVKSVCAKS